MGRVSRIHSKIEVKDRKGKVKIRPLVDVLIELIESGVSQHGACTQVGLNHQTFHNWIHRGRDSIALFEEHGDTLPKKVREQEQPYVDFVERFERARFSLQNRVELRLHSLVDAMDVREAVLVLERLNRDRWARQDTVTVTHNGEVRIDDYGRTIALLLNGVLGELGLTDEQRERVPEIVRRQLRKVTAGELATNTQPRQIGPGS